MNRLWVRLAGAFLGVALLAVAGVAVVVNRATESSFRNYVGRQNVVGSNHGLPAALEAHYAANGSWQGAEALLPGRRGSAGRGAGQEQAPGRGGEGPGYLLAAADGTILVANDETDVERELTGDERDRAIALVANERTVGYLSRSGVGAQALDRAEQNFLDEVSDALALAAIGATALALLLALALAWALLRPLGALRQSAAAIARGDLGAQMPVTGPTEYRAVGDAFNRMSAALAESTALRRRMTSDIAHELRAPVSVMRAQLEAMLDGVFPLDTGQLAIVYDETLHLSRLIEDLRTLTRAESGRLSLALEPVDPSALASLMATEFRPLAQDQQIALDTAIEPELPAILADNDRLRQVFSNLLANALAHTPSGGRITVSARRSGASVRFGVTDTGPGLTPEQVARVFERFYRTDDARQRDQGGSGLGLTITQELVRLHGGRVTLESAPGAGSTFAFEIPIAAALPKTQNGPASQ